jgi:hypothetical protein
VFNTLQIVTQNLPSTDALSSLGLQILSGAVLALAVGLFIICAGFMLAHCCRGGQDEELPGALR